VIDEERPFKWLTPSLGPTRSCLHGVHLAPDASSRVAAFDLDGTVIKSSFIQLGRPGSKGGGSKRVMRKQANGLEWEWWRAVVPQKMKEAHDSGYALVLFLLTPFAWFCPIPHCNCVALSCPQGTEYNLLTPQAFHRVDLKPEPQTRGARGMEEKDSADRCCRACPPSSFGFCMLMPFRFPNFRSESLQLLQKTGTGSLCPGCGSNSNESLPRKELR